MPLRLQGNVRRVNSSCEGADPVAVREQPTDLRQPRIPADCRTFSGKPPTPMELQSGVRIALEDPSGVCIQ